MRASAAASRAEGHLLKRVGDGQQAIQALPWLVAALCAGTLAARSLAGIGHVAGIAGLVASALVVAGLLVARHRPARCGR